MPYRVIIGLPRCQLPGAVVFAERLVRGLAAQGHDARILLTEKDCNLVQEAAPDYPLPEDLPCDKLPAGPDDTWGQRWEALERYLEERAPCFYLMLHDRRNNVIAPLLSRRVRLIGLVQADSKLELEQAGRFGEFCDAIVAASDRIHLKLADKFSYLAPRMVTIASPSTDGGSFADKNLAARYLDLFAKIEAPGRRGGFVRSRRTFVKLPDHADNALAVAAQEDAAAAVRGAVRWPDMCPYPARRRGRENEGPAASLEGHKILVAALPDRISGVDVFAVHLVRGLCARGFDARVLGNRPSDQSESLSCLRELNFEERNPSLGADYLGWPNRWRAMIDHLSRLGPCIYLPNYDHEFSCIAPQLPPHVRVVGIGHSDDPWHYEHLCRIAHGCDALVGVSRAITEHLRGLMPGFAGKLATIPYGIPTPGGELPGAAARRAHDITQPLRIVYTGRLVSPQKRALDLVAIARALDERGVPFELVVIGDGELRPAMERAAHDLILERKIWFTGAQPNASVLEFMQTCDVFLMPSAFEGLSVGMLEAMSRGVVPLVSNIRSGVPDVIVPGQNGLVVPVGDAAAFADRLEWLWKNPADLRRLGDAAAETVRANFTIGQMVDRYIELFREMVARPSKRFAGPIVPPQHLADEIKWSTWAGRVAADPRASVRRVSRRFFGHASDPA